uniref:Uncharacterized protein n=1 Tax=Chaq-like virus TaxID=2759331 RepID=A0A8K1J8Y1_9VIRU|nr:MAG: hypothetical protein [Chaq-like virus]
MNTNSVRGGRSSRNVRSRTQSNIQGGKYIPSEMPPVITSQPWNPCTVMFQTNASSTLSFIKFSDLKSRMKTQLGFNNTPADRIDFDIRIESFSLWAVADKVHLVAYPTDFLSNSGVELSRIESHSQRNMYARIGYRFPSHLYITPLSTSGASNRNILGFVSSAATSLEVHVRVLWKGADTALAIPRVTYDYVPICDSLRALADKIQEFPPDQNSDYDKLPDLPGVVD